MYIWSGGIIGKEIVDQIIKNRGDKESNEKVTKSSHRKNYVYVLKTDPVLSDLMTLFS